MAITRVVPVWLEYQGIERALWSIDVPLRQVYVEATIAEVRLTGELSRGVRWFIESGALSQASRTRRMALPATPIRV